MLLFTRASLYFLQVEDMKPWVWLRYIQDIFFIWTENENKRLGFLRRLNTFHLNLKFTHQDYTQEIFIVSPVTVIIFLRLTQRIGSTSKNQLFIVKCYVLEDDALRHWHVKTL